MREINGAWGRGNFSAMGEFYLEGIEFWC
ncbi:hypothetical protein NC652_015318 [Populus alba x Populus x berolinensis]|nr:hypothetical protein NC652_015318 [Populus alba x Populus x berolinensis]